MNSFPATTETRWMLVDDNEDILTMMSAVLEDLTGAAIECYNAPQDALAAFAEAPEKYELVITDFEMPDMDGVALCRRLRALKPGQKYFWRRAADFSPRRRRGTQGSVRC